MKKFIKKLLREGLERFSLLKEKLLSLGGVKVNEVIEEDLEKLLNRGKVFNCKVTTVKMQQSQCHRNSAMFWSNYTSDNGLGDLKIVTGWVLDKNTTWFQHSWLYLTSKNMIIETTYKRVIYFGFILSDDESHIFVDENY